MIFRQAAERISSSAGGHLKMRRDSLMMIPQSVAHTNGEVAPKYQPVMQHHASAHAGDGYKLDTRCSGPPIKPARQRPYAIASNSSEIIDASLGSG